MNAKPRILFFLQIPPPVHGVSQINFQISGNESLKNSYETKLLEIKFSNNFSEIRKFSISKFFRMFFLTLKLIQNLIFFRPHVVYFSLMPVGKGFLRDLVFVIILKLSRTKIIYHLHNKGISRQAKKQLYRLIYQYTFNHSSLIFLSEALAQQELKDLHLKNSKTFIVPNAVNDFYPKHKITRNNKPLKILFLSNLMPEKGVFYLMDCLGEISEEIPEFELHIVGAPSHNFELDFDKVLNKMSNFSNKIIYHGPLYDAKKYELLAGSDIFVFPSVFKEECMPLVILEAMQFELPVVATNIGAIDTMVIHGETGYLADSENFNEFAAHVRELANNEEKRIEMGKCGRERYLDYFNIEVFYQRIEQVISKTIHG